MKKKRPNKLIKKLAAITKLQHLIYWMLQGINNPTINLEFATFFSIRRDECYGCAATNAMLAITETSKKKFTNRVMKCRADLDTIGNTIYQFTHVLGYDLATSKAISKFELCIDSLRSTQWQIAFIYLKEMHEIIDKHFAIKSTFSEESYMPDHVHFLGYEPLSFYGVDADTTDYYYKQQAIENWKKLYNDLIKFDNAEVTTN
jgi:uncharacterized protein YqcC (DUF446 family)